MSRGAENRTRGLQVVSLFRHTRVLFSIEVKHLNVTGMNSFLDIQDLVLLTSFLSFSIFIDISCRWRWKTCHDEFLLLRFGANTLHVYAFFLFHAAEFDVSLESCLRKLVLPASHLPDLLVFFQSFPWQVDGPSTSSPVDAAVGQILSRFPGPWSLRRSGAVCCLINQFVNKEGDEIITGSSLYWLHNNLCWQLICFMSLIICPSWFLD